MSIILMSDRFFYENGQTKVRFSPIELREIKKVTLALTSGCGLSGKPRVGCISLSGSLFAGEPFSATEMIIHLPDRPLWPDGLEAG